MFIGSDGEVRTATIPLCSEDDPARGLWILEHVIMVCGKTAIYLIDQKNLMTAKIKFPKNFTFVCHEMASKTSHFDKNDGVRIAIMGSRENMQNDIDPVIWLGKVSMKHKRESSLGFLEWRRKCDQDYITDKEECCYFARNELYKNRSSRKIDSHRLFSRE